MDEPTTSPDTASSAEGVVKIATSGEISSLETRIEGEPEYTGLRVPLDRVLAVLNLHDQGLGVTAIRDAISMDTRTIHAVLARYGPEDVRAEGARQLLAAYAVNAVKDWQMASKVGAEMGKHQAARDLLLHTGVVAPVESKQQSSGIQILIGMTGVPAGPDPFEGAKVVRHDATPSPETP